MSTLYKFATEREATEYVGVVAEYIDYDLSKGYSMPLSALKWIEENLTYSVSCFIENSLDKQYFVLLFQNTEDAVAYKLMFF